jgi:DMSO/TMAO reductase YedYZ molybdopterin-dependent catalytic subunit
MGTWVLLAGLAALFVGLAAAIVMAGSIGRERSEISSSLAAIEAIGGPIPAEHGGPVRLVVPHLYFWKSPKWLEGLEVLAGDQPGFWEQNGYHMYGDPWREQRYWGD